jgi:hypothetical protein
MSIIAAIAAIATSGAVLSASDDARRSRAMLRGEDRQHAIDLKWSLWSETLDTFRDRYDRADEMVEDMLIALNSPPEDSIRVTITTAPGKEIRHGTVVTAGGITDVRFVEGMDPFDAPGWIYIMHEGLADEIRDNLVSVMLNYENHDMDGDGDPQVVTEKRFHWKDFASLKDLFEAIDNVEQETIDGAKKLWEGSVQESDKLVADALADASPDDFIFSQTVPEMVFDDLLGFLSQIQNRQALQEEIYDYLNEVLFAFGRKYTSGKKGMAELYESRPHMKRLVEGLTRQVWDIPA